MIDVMLRSIRGGDAAVKVDPVGESISFAVRRTAAGFPNAEYPMTVLSHRMGVATALLSQRLGRSPNASELADELGVDRGRVVEALIAASAKRTVSIDGPGEGPRVGVPAGVGPEPALGDIDNPETLHRLLDALPEKQRMVVLLRFFESVTQSEIAERVGLPQIEVFQLLLNALASLRQGL